jgi:hypothetical protein
MDDIRREMLYFVQEDVAGRLYCEKERATAGLYPT